LEPPPSIFDINPRCAAPSAVDNWLRKAMSKKPEDRPATMSSFVEGLKRAVRVDEGPTLEASLDLGALPAMKVGSAPLTDHAKPTEHQLPPSQRSLTPAPAPYAAPGAP